MTRIREEEDGSATAWRRSTFIKWTGWTLAMALPWWQHHKHCLEYYYYCNLSEIYATHSASLLQIYNFILLNKLTAGLASSSIFAMYGTTFDNVKFFAPNLKPHHRHPTIRELALALLTNVQPTNRTTITAHRNALILCFTHCIRCR